MNRRAVLRAFDHDQSGLSAHIASCKASSSPLAARSRMYSACAGVPGSGHASLSGVTGYPASVGIVLPWAGGLGNMRATPEIVGGVSDRFQRFEKVSGFDPDVASELDGFEFAA